MLNILHENTSKRKYHEPVAVEEKQQPRSDPPPRRLRESQKEAQRSSLVDEFQRSFFRDALFLAPLAGDLPSFLAFRLHALKVIAAAIRRPFSPSHLLGIIVQVVHGMVRISKTIRGRDSSVRVHEGRQSPPVDEERK